ncbi:MAG: hypothetical protein H6705_03505 [Myxococcales bacterium]|nr:hypothetical protein [Myxococcales bacterium]
MRLFPQGRRARRPARHRRRPRRPHLAGARAGADRHRHRRRPAMPAGQMPAGQMPAGHPPTGNMPAGHPPTGNMPAGHPPTGQMPAGHPPMGDGAQMPNGTAGLGGTLSGTITLADGVKDAVKPGAVVFIIVRSDAGEGQKGMLLAAKKIPVTGTEMFPLAFTVGPADVMMQGTPLMGKVRLEARVDQDGDAISKAPGDVVGARAGASTVGDQGIDFTLDQKL